MERENISDFFYSEKRNDKERKWATSDKGAKEKKKKKAQPSAAKIQRHIQKDLKGDSNLREKDSDALGVQEKIRGRETPHTGGWRRKKKKKDKGNVVNRQQFLKRRGVIRERDLGYKTEEKHWSAVNPAKIISARGEKKG